jgi:protein-disulfide isomerase
MVSMFRRVGFLFVLVVALCLAQTGWQTATTLPGVDLTGLTKAQKDVALSVLRNDGCVCGCDMKIAECRMEDPKCAFSRRLSDYVVHEASAGKTAAAIREGLAKLSANALPVIEEKPVKLNIDGDPVKGPANAKVTIVEFSDFQCPYCAKAVGEVNQVMQKFPKDVRLIFKQYPLDIHSQAEIAAEAALSANAQGKFWELHDKMYANFRSINRDKILVWAKEAGVDVDKLRADLDSHKYAARVQAESNEGDGVGVEGTPTFFINGRRLNVSFELSTVGPLITEATKH